MLPYDRGFSRLDPVVYAASPHGPKDAFRERQMITIKKYSNRRLYDTDESRYITLDELHHKIRDGADVCVVNAKTNADLTQATLAQIVIESRGAARLLPTPLLVQMIRMGDDALAEFMGRYMSWALSVYSQMRSSTRAFASPMATFNMPWGNQQNQGWGAASNPWARPPENNWGPPENNWRPPPAPGWHEQPPAPPRPSAHAHVPEPPVPLHTHPPQNAPANDELADLKRQIEELRAVMAAVHSGDE